MSNRPLAKKQSIQMASPGSTGPNRVPWIVAGVVVIGVVVALAVALGGESGKGPTTSDASAVLAKIKAIPTSVYDEVGAGTANNPPKAIDGPADAIAGRPLIAYVGAEYCPYCAAERWAVSVALSRFGSFSTLPLTRSSSTDTYPNTQTLSFHGSSYTSDVIAFSGTETQGNTMVNGAYPVLANPSAKVEALLNEYSSGSIPFVYFGGKYTLSGATLDPGVLQGKTALEIATELAKPDSDVARAAIGSANVITAAICAATDNQPAAVCESKGVKAGAANLPTR